MVVAPALTPEHSVYPAVSIVNGRFDEFMDEQAQCAVIGSNRTIPERIAAEP